MSASAVTHCRIGKVTLKNSGLQIVRLTTGSERVAHQMRHFVREGVEHFGEDLSGFVLMAWDRDASAHIDWTSGSLPVSVLPDFVRNRMLGEYMDWRAAQ